MEDCASVSSSEETTHSSQSQSSRRRVAVWEDTGFVISAYLLDPGNTTTEVGHLVGSRF